MRGRARIGATAAVRCEGEIDRGTPARGRARAARPPGRRASATDSHNRTKPRCQWTSVRADVVQPDPRSNGGRWAAIAEEEASPRPGTWRTVESRTPRRRRVRARRRPAGGNPDARSTAEPSSFSRCPPAARPVEARRAAHADVAEAAARRADAPLRPRAPPSHRARVRRRTQLEMLVERAVALANGADERGGGGAAGAAQAADERLARLGGREAKLSFLDLVLALGSAAAEDELAALNPFASEAQVCKALEAAVLALLTASRIGQARRCAVEAAELGTLVDELAVAGRGDDAASRRARRRRARRAREGRAARRLAVGASVLLECVGGALLDYITFDPRLLLFEFAHDLLLREAQVTLVERFVAAQREGALALPPAHHGAREDDGDRAAARPHPRRRRPPRRRRRAAAAAAVGACGALRAPRHPRRPLGVRAALRPLHDGRRRAPRAAHPRARDARRPAHRPVVDEVARPQVCRGPRRARGRRAVERRGRVGGARGGAARSRHNRGCALGLRSARRGRRPPPPSEVDRQADQPKLRAVPPPRRRRCSPTCSRPSAARAHTVLDEVDVLLHPLDRRSSTPMATGERRPIGSCHFAPVRWLAAAVPPPRRRVVPELAPLRRLVARVARGAAAIGVDRGGDARGDGVVRDAERAAHRAAAARVLRIEREFYEARLRPLLTHWALLWLRRNQLQQWTDEQVVAYLSRGAAPPNPTRRRRRRRTR